MPKPPMTFLAALATSDILATLPQGLFLVDREQRIVYWNPAAERITGYSAQEAVGQHCSFLEGIPCGRRCGLYNEEVAKPVVGVRCTVRRRDGTRIDLSKSVDLLYDSEGRVIGGVESFVDISAMKDLEKRLRRHAVEREMEVRRRTAQLEEERSQLRAMLDAMTDFAYIASPDYKIEYMNRAMIETYGEAIGKSCHRILFQRDDPCPECPMCQVLAGDTVRSECFLPMTGRTYEVIDTPVHMEDGVLSKLAVFRDITERTEAAKRLREANRELDAFVYTVSHDLRAPLTPIIGYAEFLQENYRDRLDEAALDILQDIEIQGLRLLDLLEDLLTLSQVGRLPEPAEPVSLAAVVEEAAAHWSSLLMERGLEVITDSLSALRIPRTLLGELFSNLIGNAVRYAGADGGPIEIGCRRRGSRIRVFVRDHGPGISSAEARLIFDPFFRGECARSIPGTGIGLAIVRKIVRLYDGRIWVEETPGGGATFWLEFGEKFTRSVS